MNCQFNTILNDNDNNTQSKVGDEGEITPERVYKSFQEWNKLGKQDSTELRINPRLNSCPQNNKD